MKIVSRAEWGAVAPSHYLVPIRYFPGVDLWFHHTDGPTNQSPATIQRFHMRTRGWSDVGYGWMVDEDGTVYEGRGFHVAAHCPGHNHEPSIAVIGNYSTTPPSNAVHRAVYELMDYLNAGDIRGHREGYPTSCPGDAGMAKIVNGPPPTSQHGDGLEPRMTLKQRLMDAGFGGRSADQIVAALKAGHQGTIPNRTDSVTFRRLRDAGFGVHSARTIVKATRK